MYFSKLELRHDPEVVARVARAITGDAYRLHQTLWHLFQGEGQHRDFLYRRVETANWPCFYVVSARRPVDERDVWTIQVKEYTPKLATGQRLAFSLCANPVVTKSERNGKPERHDVIMNVKKQLEQQDEARVNPAELIQNVGCDWLTKRAAKHGFQLGQVRIDGYRQHRFKKVRGGQPVCFSTLEFNGLLTVTDSDLFRQTLCHGIGPAKSFGCGLLLARRVAIH